MSEKILLYPGSFDPPTYGHYDVAMRALKLCDRLVIGINKSSGSKGYMFDSQTRKKMFESYFTADVCVDVLDYDGLTVDFARQIGAFAMIRGLRTYTDFEHEFQMAAMNKHLNPQIETIFIRTGEELAHVSSTMVKGVVCYSSVSGMVSPYVETCLRSFLTRNKENK